MKKYLINLKIKNKLRLIVASIGIVASFGIFSLVISSYDNYSRSNVLQSANKASDFILMAAGQQALERGITATVLANPDDKISYNKLASIRERGDEYLDSALAIANILAKDNTVIEKKVSLLKSDINKRTEIRQKADMILTRRAADNTFINTWIDTQTDLIMKSNELGKTMFVSDNKLENVLEFNSIVKNAIFIASEFAGRERAELGKLIGNQIPISNENLIRLMRYRGIVEENLRAVLGMRDNSNNTSEIINAINEMERKFLDDFEITREKVYSAGLNAEPYPIGTSEWIAASTDGINSILKVSETVSKEAQKLAAEQSSESSRSLFFTALLMGILLTAMFVSVWIGKLITSPVNELSQAAVEVSEGNLNQSIDYTSADEVGKLAAAFNKMIANIRKADNDLRAEKASVEKKVELAVKESEEQKDYLERSVQNILAEMEKFANGDLTVHLETEREDQIGSLYNGFNNVVANIRNMIEKVREAVEATASASSQISSSSEEMAAGAHEQSSQASEVASAVEQMTKTITETSQNVNAVSNNAINSGNIANEGGKVVNETITGIEHIAKVVIEASETVQRLGGSSQKIGEIIQVINDIADQTNLLALNAAIEAARAGEHGRGFAVVADEVRKLAERTTKATKEIADMIKQIQSDTGSAVESINVGTTEVHKGKELAKRAGESLSEIINSSKKVIDDITQVASASEEQSVTAEQISRSIESINSVTQQTAAGIQQVASAAEDLNKLTENLHNLVAGFKLSYNKSREHSKYTVRQNGKLIHY
ncbi:MAG: HAMP domain-containing protein [Melioribacteraceae bacterium]|nr:HAMP domain-containing protein [Melioribacteraceae bacterium]MCF8354185.1 HAMP domain-containing protein [Melioribacteraceae bacterium]MCF8394723.1 HAMP domain-containing protein [Melioribacteraceae bacterium]MCF8418108.1 HAMP domain-containing protein [Melioribacteraceae bacterium]